MLRDIREASANWIGKTIMLVVVGFLIVSFAIWGIGDVFRGFGRSTVAQIGKTEITIDQFRQLFNDQLQQLSRQLRRPVTAEQARANKLDRELLGKIVSEAVLDERVRQMRLNLDDKEIAKLIMADPSFRGLSGQFDRGRFELIIRQAGYTEPRFVAEQRRVALRRQLVSSVASAPHVPNAEIEALHRFQNEKRSIDFIMLDQAAAGAVPVPTQEQLSKYFEERKPLFRAPEYRKIVALVLTPENIARWTVVTDADAKLAYEANRSSYVTPERRHVQQIVFPDEAAARAASERIAKDLTFAALAAERNLKESDIDLGTLAKAAMVDPAIADAAFALKAGEVSAPVKGRFGTALVHVLKIEPEVVRTYEQVADEIKQSLALERARADVLKTYDKIEDERAGGRNLTEVAQKHNLTTLTFEAVDRAGNGPDGQPIADLPKMIDLVSAAFASDVGVENDPMQADRSYVWYEVAGITPSRERNLDEVKERVAAQWRADEIAKLLKAKTDAMVDKLKAGSKIAELAAGGLKVETAAGLKRGNPTEAIPIKALDAVFRTPKGAAGSAEGDKESVRFVFVVKDVNVPKLDMTSAETKRLSTVLRQSYADTLLSQYIARLETDIGTSFNQSALDQAVGGGTSN